MTRRPGPLAAVTLLALALMALAVPLRQTASGQAAPTPLPLYALPSQATERAYTSGSLALLPDGRTLIVANALNNTVTLAIPTLERIITVLPVGRDPRSVAVTPDGAFALVANRLDASLTLIDLPNAAVLGTIALGGASPVQVVAGERGLAYVALRDSNEVVEVDIAGRSVRRRIPTAAAPNGLALWGEFLYVTHFWTGELSLIYLPSGQVTARTVIAPGAGVAASIAPDIARGLAYVPFTGLNTANPAPLYDNLAYPAVARVDLRALRADPAGLIALDSADRPVNLPFSAAVDRFRQRLYVAHFGSGAVTVLDTASGAVRAHIPVGSGPFGVTLTVDGSLLYVHNLFDGTISTINTSSLEVMRVQVVAPLDVPAETLIGAQLFNGAADPRMTTFHGVSCATCHFDGLSDGRVWQGINGGQNTPLLYGLAETAPYLASGGWDDLADIELKIRALQAGSGLVDGLPLATAADLHAGLSDDLDALTAYLTRLQPSALPPAGSETSRARGQSLFTDSGCAQCHAEPAYTDLNRHDVGTGGPIDTPSLRWLPLSAPYFHDGSAATLARVFELPGIHQIAHLLPPADLAALLDYLNSLPQ